MKTHRNEDGFASLVIAIVLVLVLSLITVGFATLMRREERSALDRQLSSQAYYAAESGINDATKAINEGYAGSKTGCLPGQGVDTNPAYAAGLANLNDNTVKFPPPNNQNPTEASYSCLLINPYPKDLHYDPIATTVSRTVQFTAINPDPNNDPATVKRIVVSWQDSENTLRDHFVNNCNTFPTASDWAAAGNLGIPRIELIPVGSDYSRSALDANAFTAFLCPSSSAIANTVNYDNSSLTTGAGVIMNGHCNTANKPYCSVTINFPGTPPSSTFFLNMRSLYSATSINVTGFDSAGNQLRLTGAQTLVDSTGKAQDVLRRIQVRVANKNGYDIPDGVHGDVCKQFDLDPASTTSGAPSGSVCDITNLTY